MAEGTNRRPGPEYEGGAQPAQDLPPDEPGKGRGPVFFLIALIAVLVMAIPIAWGLWALITVGYAIGATALVFLWIIWGCCALAFLWVVRALWKRAA
jgi:hypothetical protein